jgi:hypothetical protein
MKPLKAGHVAVMIRNESDTPDISTSTLLPPHGGLAPPKSKPAEVLKNQGVTFLSDEDSPSECAAVMAPFTDFCTAALTTARQRPG